MRLILLAAFCLLSAFSFCQEKEGALVWVDKNLSLRMSGEPERIQMPQRFRLLKSYKDSIYYQVLINDSSELKVKDEHSFRISLMGLLSGMFGKDEYKNYSHSITDTLLGSVPGLFISLHNDLNDNKPKDIFCLVTLQDYHSYFLIAYSFATLGINDRKSIASYYKMLAFSGSPFPGFSAKN